METITIEAATHESGRVLTAFSLPFTPSGTLMPAANALCRVRSNSETQTLEITDAIELHVADGADGVNSVTFALENDQYSRRVQRLDDWPGPKLTLLPGGDHDTMRPYDLRSVDPLKTYAVQLLQFDGRTSTAGVYDSPTGKLPRVDDVIPVDESGGRARVTAVSRSDHPPIRADLLS